MDLQLTGKVALITGGSDGIGKATAMELSQEGVNVAICGRREDVLNAAADEIRAGAKGAAPDTYTACAKGASVAVAGVRPYRPNLRETNDIGVRHSARRVPTVVPANAWKA